MKKHKDKTLPSKFEKGFLAKMDGRFELARTLKGSYEEITSDLGGVEGLSHIKRSLVERFVWLEFIMRGIELQIAEADKKDSAELLGRWVQAVNSLTGLARSLGLERKAKNIESLQTYVAKKSKRRRT